MTCLPAAKVSFAASHSWVCPGAAVFGIGVGVQEVVAVGAGGRRAGRAALVVRALRRDDDDEALAVPFLSPTESRLDTLRNQSVT